MASSHFVSRQLLLLLFSLFAVSRTTAVFVSIDCGTNGTYIDESNVVWTPDDLYISTGKNQVIPGTASRAMSTLRAFPTGNLKKNCYSVEVDKGERLLVRVSFYYGNYDKRSSPPSFDLQLDGNHWVTVTTSVDMRVYYEVVYVAKRAAIGVCVAQTVQNNVPFVSAIEVRSLEADMYSHVDASSGLFLIRRFNFGSNETIRYPDDTYDRIWTPVAGATGLTAVSSDSLVMLTDAADQPPSSVMQTALTTSTSSGSILLKTNLGEDEVPAYINMYFAEMSELDSTQKREFVVRVDKDSSDPIKPPYQSAIEMTFFNLTASGNSSITLVPTATSTLPPIISAMEVFVVSPLAEGTHSDDLDAVSLLQQQFQQLQLWSGDPCLPAKFTWEWVACSSDKIPRITALYLDGFDLSGLLPDFSGLAALETLDMHNNSLSGEIPDFLGTFRNLKELNLADNDFSGPVPSSISKNTKLKLEVSGNPNLCVSGNSSCEDTSSGTDETGTTPAGSGSSGKTKKKKSSKLPVILGVSIPLVFWAIVGLLVLNHRRRKAAVAAVTAAPAGKQGKPTGPPQNMEMGFVGQVHQPDDSSANDEYIENIEQQMGSAQTQYHSASNSTA